MRISMVATCPPDDCGVASYTGYLTQVLRDADPAVEVTMIPASGVTYQPQYPRLLAQAVTATRPDVVHIQHEYGIFGADDRFPQLLSTLAETGRPVVVTMHTVHTNLSVDLGCGWTKGFSLAGLAIEPYQRRITDLASLVLVHHEQAIRRTLLRQGLAADRVVAIPHGTLCLDRSVALAGGSGAVPAGRPLLVVPGYLRRSKNLHAVVEAFATVASGRPDATLWIGGYSRQPSAEADAYLDGCLKRAAGAGVADRVVVVREPVPDPVMSALLAAADVVLCVYDEDTRSASGILHRALGVDAVVVASRRPKFQEIAEVCDELLVDPNRPAELARLVERLLDDHPFRRAVREPLRDLAARTAWPVVARAHLDAYARIVGQGHAAAHSG